MVQKTAFLVCGEALIDLIPRDVEGERWYRGVPGGSPYNVAIGLGRLGAETFFLGRLSHDPNGERLKQRLTDNGVGLDFTRFTDDPSMLAYVFPPESGHGDVRYAFYLTGTAGGTFTAEDFAQQNLAPVRLLHIGSFSAVLRDNGRLIRDFAASDKIMVSYDPNIRPSVTPDKDAVRAEVEANVRIANIVKLSDVDAEFLYPGLGFAEVAKALLGLGPAVVAITRGGEGALVFSRTLSLTIPGLPVKVVDTVGAGDTFMAGFLWDLGRRKLLDDPAALKAASEADLHGAATLACKAAAIVCGRAGAEPPFAKELLG